MNCECELFVQIPLVCAHSSTSDYQTDVIPHMEVLVHLFVPPIIYSLLVPYSVHHLGGTQYLPCAIGLHSVYCIIISKEPTCNMLHL
jgi:hypothetical protein